MTRTRFGDGREGPQAAVETIEHLQFDVSPAVAARSSEAKALRAEIIAVGRKLWQRQYVDGNGGNISVRLGSRHLLNATLQLGVASGRGWLEHRD